MGWRTFLGFIFFLIVMILLVFYWFIPFDTIEFDNGFEGSNFSANSTDPSNMQFYSSMRYSEKDITYKIYSCPLQKKNGMERALDFVQEETVLSFNSVSSDEEISIFCEQRSKRDGRFFVAGEGGATNVTLTNNFNVILHGEILLLRDFYCEDPNVAIHELLHALGFIHSENPSNILYPVSKCNQEIGQDTVDTINGLYSTDSLPDLSFEDVSAVMRGKYLDAEFGVRNNGLIESPSFNVFIYADDKLVKEITIEPLGIGFGKVISLTNIWVSKLTVDELRFVINSNFQEIDKENNRISLNVKN